MRYFFSFALLFITANIFSQNKFPFQNPKIPIDQRVKDLLSRMTVAEKAGQLNQLNGGAFTGPALNDAGQAEKAKMVDRSRETRRSRPAVARPAPRYAAPRPA